LAAVWLETQRKLWPLLAEGYLLQPASPEQISHMSGLFVTRFIEKRIDPFVVGNDVKSWQRLGTAYLRYSSTQQNPRSLDDQLTLQLHRAQANKVFIPWEYVFADAAVTGVVNNRTGYNLCKLLMQREGPGAVDVLYVDELSRASRDGVETLLLGTLVENLGKRIIGVSDGFDSSDESSRMKLHFFAMFNEQFVTQHRQRVMRGRDGARRRGGVVGRIALGLKAVPIIDGHGAPVKGRQHKCLSTYAIDEENRHIIELLAKRFVDERQSTYKICREFNTLRLAGRTSWQQGSLLKMLRNEIYAGILVYQRIKHVVDPISGKRTLVKRPRREWKVRRIPKCAIFSWKRWKQICARVSEVQGAGKVRYERRSKNQVYPTRLFSGLLFCGACGSELKLYRSTPNAASYYCRHGRTGARGCTLARSKSTKLIEPALFSYLRREVLTECRILTLVEMVNAAIAEEASKPAIDTAPLKERSTDLKRKRDRLIAVIEEGGCPVGGGIGERISVLEGQIREVAKLESEAESARTQIPSRVDFDIVKALLPRMREVLNQDVAIAMPAMRALFGKIWLYDGGPDKNAPWVAKFRSNVLILAKHLHCEGDSSVPDPLLQLNLKQRIWNALPLEEVQLLSNSTSDQFSEAVLSLADEGKSIAEIETALAGN